MMRVFSLVFTIGLLAGAAFAQPPVSGDSPLDLLGGLGGMPGQPPQPVVSAEWMATADDRAGLLTITVELPFPWHIYSVTQPDGGPERTQIEVDWPQGLQPADAFRPDEPPEKRKLEYFDVPLEEHYGRVVWRVPFRIAEGVHAKQLTLAGRIHGQICHDDQGCVPLDTNQSAFAAQYAGVLQEDPLPAQSAEPAAPSSDDIAAPQLGYVLPMAILGGLLGGLILNVMPCVLPVISLKVMSFVQQSGESRGRILVTNLWYTLGVLLVFMALAYLFTLGAGWGGQFNNQVFNIALISVLVAMALSALGVWEIPMPGVVGGSAATELAQREGAAGSVFKGALTTVLATPCGAPILAWVLTLVRGQPSMVIYAVFASMAVGMASPYLLASVSPALVGWLPKPGAWMNTFKQIMGFILLATAVWIFWFLPTTMVLPTTLFCVGVSVAFWWIGRTPLTAAAGKQLAAWTAGAVLTAVIGFVSFGWFQEVAEKRAAKELLAHVTQQQEAAGVVVDLHDQIVPEKAHELRWQPFSQKRLEFLIAQNRTVMVDFTARWCLTCKALEAAVLNTNDVRRVADEHGIRTLLADWSDRGDEVGKVLDQLGGRQVPVLAIFPAGRADQPIILRGGYTQETLLKHLQDAVATEAPPPTGQTAMRPIGR